MDDQYVDVYIDLRPQAYTYMQNGSLAEEVKLNRPPTGGRSSRETCAHTSLQEVFAYARVLEVHWPMVFCDDCLEILEDANRSPFSTRPNRAARSTLKKSSRGSGPRTGLGRASLERSDRQPVPRGRRPSRVVTPLNSSGGTARGSTESPQRKGYPRTSD